VYPPVLWYDVPLGTRRWLRTSCTMRMVISFVACADYIDTTSYWNYWNFFRIFRWCSILTAHFFIFSFIFIHSAIEWNSLASYCCTIIFLMNGYLMSISNNCLAGIQCVTSIPSSWFTLLLPLPSFSLSQPYTAIHRPQYYINPSLLSVFLSWFFNRTLSLILDSQSLLTVLLNGWCFTKVVTQCTWSHRIWHRQIVLLASNKDFYHSARRRRCPVITMLPQLGKTKWAC